jgi:hypothetical protein
MVSQNRKTRSLGPAGWLALLVALVASTAAALLPDETPADKIRNRLAALRTGMVAQMNVFAQNYASADWSAVTSELAAHPDGTGDAAIMTIRVSFGNVYLNRFEIAHDRADLEQAIRVFESVTAYHASWGHRTGSAGLVAYLDVSLSRVVAECDIGGLEERIAALWDAAMAVTADEAGPALPSIRMQAILPFRGVDDAGQASLLAAAANFLPDDPRAASWEERARLLASRFPASVCQEGETIIALSQGALAYRLDGRSVPREFATVLAVASPNYPPPLAYLTDGPVDAVVPGDSLDRAIADSRVVAYRVYVYLDRFPPGSQCSVNLDPPR